MLVCMYVCLHCIPVYACVVYVVCRYVCMLYVGMCVSCVLVYFSLTAPLTCPLNGFRLFCHYLPAG
jgi:hypothetical protein